MGNSCVPSITTTATSEEPTSSPPCLASGGAIWNSNRTSRDDGVNSTQTNHGVIYFPLELFYPFISRLTHEIRAMADGNRERCFTLGTAGHAWPRHLFQFRHVTYYHFGYILFPWRISLQTLYHTALTFSSFLNYSSNILSTALIYDS